MRRILTPGRFVVAATVIITAVAGVAGFLRISAAGNINSRQVDEMSAVSREGVDPAIQLNAPQRTIASYTMVGVQVANNGGLVQIHAEADGHDARMSNRFVWGLIVYKKTGGNRPSEEVLRNVYDDQPFQFPADGTRKHMTFNDAIELQGDLHEYIVKVVIFRLMGQQTLDVLRDKNKDDSTIVTQAGSNVLETP